MTVGPQGTIFRRVCLVAASCLIGLTAKQRPLSGATMTLVPEPFMGARLQSYSGTATARGCCQLNGAEADVPGLSPGHYQARSWKRLDILTRLSARLRPMPREAGWS